MKYIMKNCGCELEKKDLIRVKNAYRCKHHKENGIDYIEKKCVDCPKIMRLNSKQSTAIRCPECREKIKKKWDKDALNKFYGKHQKNLSGNTMDLSLYTQGLDRYLKTHKVNRQLSETAGK